MSYDSVMARSEGPYEFISGWFLKFGCDIDAFELKFGSSMDWRNILGMSNAFVCIQSSWLS